jgi:4-amino-4-deoxy-L-arabinose transferase-like glycosyltransferase
LKLQITHFQIQIFICLAGLLLFIPNLGSVHLFDWDEINFAESAREMLLTNDFLRVQINYEPFWEKPPLFFWLQSFFMHFLGVNEFSARLPNALVGVATLVLLYRIGKNLFNQKFGLLWSLAYAGTFLCHLYFKSGIIDPLFNLFIFLGIYQIHLAFAAKNGIKNGIYAGVLIGLGMLTKGPVALLVSGLVACLVATIIYGLRWRDLGVLILFVLTAFMVAGLWFGVETAFNGTWFLKTFIEYQIRLFNTEDSGHGQPFYYHPLVLLVGCFPISLFFLNKLWLSKKEFKEKPFLLWMTISFWIVLILFSIVKTKIVHYTSFCYFPLSFLAVYNIIKATENKKSLVLTKIGLVLIGLIWVVLIVGLPFFIKYQSYFTPLIKDPFAVACIQANVAWNGFEFLTGFVLLSAIIYALFIKKNAIQLAITLFIGVILTVQLVLYVYLPKIEYYVQGKLIAYLEKTKNEKCYVKCVGFKSYAQYFYSNRLPNYPKNENVDNETWLTQGEIDRPVYLITKIDRDGLQTFSHVKKLEEANGWVLYKREPSGK